MAAFPDGTCGDVRLQYAVEPEPLDTAGAIRFAADHAGIDDTFVVANGDVMTDLDVGALVDGYHSDLSRVYAFKRADESLRQVYAIVGDGAMEAEFATQRAVADELADRSGLVVATGGRMMVDAVNAERLGATGVDLAADRGDAAVLDRQVTWLFGSLFDEARVLDQQGIGRQS